MTEPLTASPDKAGLVVTVEQTGDHSPAKARVDSDGKLRHIRTDETFNASTWSITSPIENMDGDFQPLRVDRDKAGVRIKIQFETDNRPRSARIDEGGYIRTVSGGALVDERRCEILTNLDEIDGPHRDYTIHHTDGRKETFTAA